MWELFWRQLTENRNEPPFPFSLMVIIPELLKIAQANLNLKKATKRKRMLGFLLPAYRALTGVQLDTEIKSKLILPGLEAIQKDVNLLEHHDKKILSELIVDMRHQKPSAIRSNLMSYIPSVPHITQPITIRNKLESKPSDVGNSSNPSGGSPGNAASGNQSPELLSMTYVNRFFKDAAKDVSYLLEELTKQPDGTTGLPENKQ